MTEPPIAIDQSKEISVWVMQDEETRSHRVASAYDVAQAVTLAAGWFQARVIAQPSDTVHVHIYDEYDNLLGWIGGGP